MTIAILATGDEIVHGDTLNTNAHTIARIISSEGLALSMHLACSDKEQDIIDSLTFLSQKNDIIILTGGLGPTSDDRTRFALARFLNLELTEFEQALQHVQTRLSRAHLAFNAGNRQQSLFPKQATLLPNPHGTALGCYLKTEAHKIYVLLPGPPRECMPMFQQHVMPVLQQTQHSDKQILKWRLFGVPESIIAEQLDRVLKHLPCATGYRLETPYLEFKVRCQPEDVPAIKQIVEPVIAPHLIATIEQRASERLRAAIEALQQPIVIIDEVTGGVLQQLLQTPRNYPWLKFNSGESAQFEFRISGLTAYWLEEPGKYAYFTIDYKSPHHHGSELQTIPNFSQNTIIHYAAEWISFRILPYLTL